MVDVYRRPLPLWWFSPKEMRWGWGTGEGGHIEVYVDSSDQFRKCGKDFTLHILSAVLIDQIPFTCHCILMYFQILSDCLLKVVHI